jgi:Zn-finger nucleic acid-binding protein
MEKIEFGGALVSRCTHCRGLFFDEFEKEALRKVRDVESLDTGDAKTGKQFNTIDRINCPRCSGRMMRMVDLQQPHIWFEQCKVCGGSFFDAGEFRDLSHHTILDFFKDMLVTERK